MPLKRRKLIPVSLAWSMPIGVLPLPPGRDASPSQGYPTAVCRRYPFVYVYGNKATGEACAFCDHSLFDPQNRTRDQIVT